LQLPLQAEMIKKQMSVRVNEAIYRNK
jgi:hypothetical protein